MFWIVYFLLVHLHRIYLLHWGFFASLLHVTNHQKVHPRLEARRQGFLNTKGQLPVHTISFQELKGAHSRRCHSMFFEHSSLKLTTRNHITLPPLHSLEEYFQAWDHGELSIDHASNSLPRLYLVDSLWPIKEPIFHASSDSQTMCLL